MVVAASFLVNMIADGVTFSFGVMFDEFEGEFESTKVKIYRINLSLPKQILELVYV